MKRLLAWVLMVLATTAGGAAAGHLAVEQDVETAVQSPEVTIVHLWAPWCPNCKAELESGGWKAFLLTHPDVNVVFVTVWRGEPGSDGREMLERYGIGSQANFRMLVHPNASRDKTDKMTEFLGFPVSWIPSTWVFRNGTLRYALNYGELRFPMLNQMVRDAADKWEH